jgi:hypothetical protein
VEHVLVGEFWGMIGQGVPAVDGVVTQTIQQGWGKPFPI